MRGLESFLPANVTMRVLVYVKSGLVMSAELYNQIGKLLDGHLKKKMIILNDIKEDIKRSVNGDVPAVSIDCKLDEVTHNNDDMNRFYLSRKMGFDSAGELVTQYDYKLELIEL